jgi:hypothetical protein
MTQNELIRELRHLSRLLEPLEAAPLPAAVRQPLGDARLAVDQLERLLTPPASVLAEEGSRRDVQSAGEATDADE